MRLKEETQLRALRAVKKMSAEGLKRYPIGQPHAENVSKHVGIKSKDIPEGGR